MVDVPVVDADPEDNNDDNQVGIEDETHGQYSPPLGIEDAYRAHEDLQKLLKPNQKTGSKFDPIMQERLEQVHQFLWNYVDPNTMACGGTVGSSWKAASEQTAHALGRGNYLARNLRKWGCAYISDREDLPDNQYGHNEWLLNDKDLVHKINLHLQGIGKYVKAMDIVKFLDTPKMRTRLNQTTPIHQTTAQCWMQKLGYHWANTPKGQYVDGHKREDVVAYRQN